MIEDDEDSIVANNSAVCRSRIGPSESDTNRMQLQSEKWIVTSVARYSTNLTSSIYINNNICSSYYTVSQ